MTDQELLLSIKKGDLGAVEILVEKYKSIVNALARPYYLVGGDYEDLVQEGMIGLYKAVTTYEESSGYNFTTYAFACIKNKILDAIKIANRNKHKALNNYISLTVFTESNNMIVKSPEDYTIEQERNQDIINEIKSVLTQQEYLVFELYLEGMSYCDIAKKSQLSVKTVDNLLQKIKRKVRATLKLNTKK